MPGPAFPEGEREAGTRNLAQAALQPDESGETAVAPCTLPEMRIRLPGHGLVVAALLSSPALLYAKGDAGRPEALFEQRCGQCHTIEQLAPSLARRAPKARLAYLERFLARHYAPDPSERREIAALLSEAADRT
jgi:mono/diheme cytochrome c family protein